MTRPRRRPSGPPSISTVAIVATLQGVGFALVMQLIEGGEPWALPFRVAFFGGCMFAFGMLSRRRQLAREADRRAQSKIVLRSL